MNWRMRGADGLLTQTQTVDQDGDKFDEQKGLLDPVLGTLNCIGPAGDLCLASFLPIFGVKTLSSSKYLFTLSVLSQNPVAIPARYAEPRAVVSNVAGGARESQDSTAL